MTQPLKVAVTGAAGQIGYSLLFRIASGALLGPQTPVQLQLLEIEPALKALEGVVMELDDCAFTTLAGVEIGHEATKIFDGANLALLARLGQERSQHFGQRVRSGKHLHLRSRRRSGRRCSMLRVLGKDGMKAQWRPWTGRFAPTRVR